MKLGILKETKIPVDHRVAFTPTQCKHLLSTYSSLEIFVQPSDIRCYTDDEYSKAGATLTKDLTTCDVLFGVKEVNIESLIPSKKYFFFSHTIKKQPYNKKLLQSIISNDIQLVDYECLVDSTGKRVVAFGRWAGIVGAYNALLTYGLKYNLYELKPANKCFDKEELWNELAKISLPAIKILLTGGGRVAKGAQEVLDACHINNVSMPDYTHVAYEEPVYIQLDSDAYNQRTDGSPFEFEDFYSNPEKYTSTFHQYTPHTDVLIAGAYWDPKAPKLFTRKDVNQESFKINTIADITCDIEGSIPTTIRPSTIDKPCYDINRNSFEEEPSFSNTQNITVMAVDNLPCELPRDASKSFGNMLIDNVMDDLCLQNSEGIINEASITKGERLTEKFQYLTDYIA